MYGGFDQQPPPSLFRRRLLLALASLLTADARVITDRSLAVLALADSVPFEVIEVSPHLKMEPP